MTFSEVVMECYQNKEFMKEYRRLSGSDLGIRKGLSIEIDKAT